LYSVDTNSYHQLPEMAKCQCRDCYYVLASKDLDTGLVHGDWAVVLNQMLSQALIARKIRIINRFSRVDFCESEMLKVEVGNHWWHLHCCV